MNQDAKNNDIMRQLREMQEGGDTSREKATRASQKAYVKAITDKENTKKLNEIYPKFTTDPKTGSTDGWYGNTTVGQKNKAKK